MAKVSQQGIAAQVDAIGCQGQQAQYLLGNRDTKVQAMFMIDGAPFGKGAPGALQLTPNACCALPCATVISGGISGAVSGAGAA